MSRGGLSRARGIGLSLIADKCTAIYISEKTPVSVRDIVFTIINESHACSLNEGEATSFLGADVGFKIMH